MSVLSKCAPNKMKTIRNNHVIWLKLRRSNLANISENWHPWKQYCLQESKKLLHQTMQKGKEEILL